MSRNLKLTSTYQLYCPDPVETPIVLHVRAKATIAAVKPASRRHILVSGFQTEVTFPQGIASALAQMSPIIGNVTGTVLVIGATPESARSRSWSVAVIPRSVPAAGFNFWVPARGASLGILTATAKAIAVEETSRFRLTLTVGAAASGQTASSLAQPLPMPRGTSNPPNRGWAQRAGFSPTRLPL